MRPLNAHLYGRAEQDRLALLVLCLLSLGLEWSFSSGPSPQSATDLQQSHVQLQP
ncbi:unnamed protein product [Protopolystoma xenopodis]|uniref:Uncharacterized protein n=1 Tax=Protopolystoma xenopodis TaxID=117903 RepID=A0A3S5ADV7_9PLAT|nr:unnamed protein product [Protopolystoma xenopodis]